MKVIERNKIETIVSSPGSEWPPVWEALAELTAKGRSEPSFINCRHEALVHLREGRLALIDVRLSDYKSR